MYAVLDDLGFGNLLEDDLRSDGAGTGNARHVRPGLAMRAVTKGLAVEGAERVRVGAIDVDLDLDHRALIASSRCRSRLSSEIVENWRRRSRSPGRRVLTTSVGSPGIASP